MGTSTIYTAKGSTTDSYAGLGLLFVQVPVSYSTGTNNDGSAATVTEFDAHLSSQSGNDVLSIQNHTSTWNGNTESVTTSGSNVYVNNTLYGTYSFSGQDLIFNFSSGNSSPVILGAIMDAVAYQNTVPRAAETETVSWSFTANATTSAPSDTINVAALSLEFTATGSTTDSYSGVGFMPVQVPLSYSTAGAAAAVSSFDARVSGGGSLSIQNNTSTWDGHTESVTTSGDNVYVNNTLYGAYSFSGQDLVFTFSTSNSNPDIIGAIMDAVNYQDATFLNENRSASTATVSWTFSSSAGTAVTAPSDTINIAAYTVPDSVGIVEGNPASSNVSLTTHVGTAVFVAPTAFFDENQGGYNSTPYPQGVTISIVNGGGQLGFNPATVTYAGGPVPYTQIGPGSWQLGSDRNIGVNIVSSSEIQIYPGGDGNLTDLLPALNNITYENTSSAVPTSAEIVIEPNDIETYGYPTPVVTDLTVTVNVTPLPSIVTETATVTSGAAASGSAGASGTGALAGDSDYYNYTLSVSAITGGTLGSATHGVYGDLTLNADGSFSYVADATSAEAANIAAASGPVTDAFTFSVSDGHGAVAASTLDINLDATKPSISSIGFSPSSGDLAVGANETITLNLGNVGAIDIAGNGPTLTLNDGGTATYDAAASTSTSLVFDYKVLSTDTDVASLAVKSVNLGATTLTNPSGVATVTSLPVTGLTQSGPQIDTTTPAFTAIAENPSSGEIGFNTKVTFTLTTNDPVTVDTTNGAPTLSLNDNGTATYDAADSTSTSLVFNYTLTGTDIANVASLQATSFNIGSAVIGNGAGTPANVSLTGLSQSGPQIDLPQLTGALATVPAGTYGPGEQMELLLEFNKAVTVTGDTVTLALNDGGTATLNVANTAALDQFGLVAFDYKVASNAQDVSALAVTSISNGSTIEDNLGDPVQFPNGLPSFAGVAIDPAAPSQDNVPCYCRGTLIAAEQGNVPVERLAIGDEVMTASGALRPIKWIGTRSYSGRFIAGSKDILPVCFKAGSLGEGLPQRDLWISPHHAMYFENESSGLLIEARDLLNGVSIAQAEYVEEVEYFHIELEKHDVIIAEGALSETFVDFDSRGMFRNAHEYRALYTDENMTHARYYAPRRDEGFEVEAVRQRLASQAGLLPAVDQPSAGPLRGYVDLVSAACIAGWAQNIDHTEAPVCLDIVAGGRLIGQVLANRHRDDLQHAGLGSGRHSFEFTPPAGLGLSPDTIEVRRSIDGAAVKFSAASRRALQQLAVA